MRPIRSRRPGGALVVAAQHDFPDDWHQPLRQVRADQLSEDTGQTPGMTRREAISAQTVGSQRIWMGRTSVAAHHSSGDHHHGDSETAIHVLSGHPVFVFARAGEEVRLTTSPGLQVLQCGDPSGTGSVTTIPVASEGPLLKTSSEYSMSSPALTTSGPSVL